MRRMVVLSGLLLSLLLLTGCGGTKADVVLLLMPAKGVPEEAVVTLEKQLQEELADTATLQVRSSSIYTAEKLFLEIAGGDNGMMVVPYDAFRELVEQGGYCLPLDKAIHADEFPEGVFEADAPNGSVQKQLLGIPIQRSRWFADASWQGQPLIAFIPSNAPNPEKAMQVMRVIAGNGEPSADEMEGGAAQ